MKSTIENEKKEGFFRERLSQTEGRVALKAGIAASLSLYLGVSFAKFLERPDYLLSGTWCVLSTFVVLQGHLGGTYRAAFVRLLGVVIGSLMGGLFTSIFGSSSITLGVSVVLTVLICNILRLKESVRIACLSLSVVMILWGLHPEISPWTFSFHRSLDSTLGIAVAVAVSHLLWPAKATEKLRLNLVKLLTLIHRLFLMELGLKPPPTNYQKAHQRILKELSKAFQETETILEDFPLEVLKKSRSIEEWHNLLNHVEHLYEASLKLYVFQCSHIKKALKRSLRKKLEGTMHTCADAFKEQIRFLKSGKEKKSEIDLEKEKEMLQKEFAELYLSEMLQGSTRKEVEETFLLFYTARK